MMNVSLLLFDCLLGLALVAVASGILWGRELFRSIVLFIMFGLLLTVAWCRLDAVDIALAEAGIGAGLTGALLLNTWAATSHESKSQKRNDADHDPSNVVDRPLIPVAYDQAQSLGSIALVAIVPSLVLTVVAMASVVLPLGMARASPRIAIDEALAHSGVSHPVTAVLLNFRAYDTLLEIAVLLAAALAVLPLIAKTERMNSEKVLRIGIVLDMFNRLVVPVAAVVAAYILWIGTKAPGGAFQSAAMLSAIGVLLLTCGWRSPNWTKFFWRVLLVLGLSIFLLVGFSGAFVCNEYLHYPSAWAGSLIFLIECGLTVSISAILISLFTSTSPTNSRCDTKNRPAAIKYNTTIEAES
jgi:multisubunit Na+/H+ antiporter MnhB subunit